MKRYIPLLALLLASLLHPQAKVNINNLVQYGDKMYKTDDDRPYTGKVFDLYKSNGNKKVEGYYKDGLRNRKWEWWSEDGKMDSSGTYEDGKMISEKWWDREEKERDILSLPVLESILQFEWFTKSKSLPVLGSIPRFEMTNSKGVPFGTNDLTGKIWVADFIFTTCAGPCPIMSTEMADIHKTFLNDNEIHTVTYTVNPDYDTPEVLADYAERFNADRSQWHFLTAPYEDIQSIIADGFKMGDMEDIVFHSNRFALIDRNMNIRGYYIGTESDDVKKLKRDINRLIKESLNE